MNVSLVPTSAPPTPVEVLNRIVAQFANPVDPKTPFINHPLYAKRKLAAAMFEEAFGEASPISKLVSSYATSLETPISTKSCSSRCKCPGRSCRLT